MSFTLTESSWCSKMEPQHHHPIPLHCLQQQIERRERLEELETEAVIGNCSSLHWVTVLNVVLVQVHEQTPNLPHYHQHAVVCAVIWYNNNGIFLAVLVQVYCCLCSCIVDLILISMCYSCWSAVGVRPNNGMDGNVTTFDLTLCISRAHGSHENTGHYEDRTRSNGTGTP